MSNIPRLVVLRDCPADLEGVRKAAACVAVDTERVIVAHGGNNEHFTATGRSESVDGVSVPIYAWSYTTAIAE
ncbi:DUF5988 family protein [Embleya sp. MST-111070]|uniref:DUF5988 family protein n=1 Tax=Embleya sp. MST-111070 TaxID=3398231 RepID=UPI003F74151C